MRACDLFVVVALVVGIGVYLVQAVLVVEVVEVVEVGNEVVRCWWRVRVLPRQASMMALVQYGAQRLWGVWYGGRAH